MNITKLSDNEIKWRTFSGLEYRAKRALNGTTFEVYRRAHGKPYKLIRTHEIRLKISLKEAIEEITKEQYNY